MGIRRIVGVWFLVMGVAVAAPVWRPGEWIVAAQSRYATTHYRVCLRSAYSLTELAGRAHAQCVRARPALVQGRTVTVYLQCHSRQGSARFVSRITAQEHVNQAGTEMRGHVVARVESSGYTQRVTERTVSRWLGACTR